MPGWSLFVPKNALNTPLIHSKRPSSPKKWSENDLKMICEMEKMWDHCPFFVLTWCDRWKKWLVFPILNSRQYYLWTATKRCSWTLRSWPDSLHLRPKPWLSCYRTLSARSIVSKKCHNFFRHDQQYSHKKPRFFAWRGCRVIVSGDLSPPPSASRRYGRTS